MAGRAHLPPLQIDRKVARGDSLAVCEASCFSIRSAERSNILKICQFGWQPGNAKSTSLSATTATSFKLLTNISQRKCARSAPIAVRYAAQQQYERFTIFADFSKGSSAGADPHGGAGLREVGAGI